MSTSMHVKGFKPPDERHRRMAAVWEACRAAGVDTPAEVDDYFDGCKPDDAGVEVDVPAKHWTDGDMRLGFELQVADIPAGVTVLRFYTSY